jgi:hypothetical protein
MAKRDTGVGAKNKNRIRPHKTQKRLAAKRELLAKTASKRRK